MIGYKIVKIIDDRYYSVFVDTPDRVEYILNQAVYPAANNGPLTVFSKKKYAINWVDSWGDFLDIEPSLFKCEYELNNTSQLFLMSKSPVTGFSMTTDKSYCPTGTVLANWVKLTRQINR